MCKAEARRSRANDKRGYQPDENGWQQLENRANNVESKFENQTVVASINGEEIQDETVGEEVFIALFVARKKHIKRFSPKDDSTKHLSMWPCCYDD